jgi:hypothetical protein
MISCRRCRIVFLGNVTQHLGRSCRTGPVQRRAAHGRKGLQGDGTGVIDHGDTAPGYSLHNVRPSSHSNTAFPHVVKESVGSWRRRFPRKRRMRKCGASAKLCGRCCRPRRVVTLARCEPLWTGLWRPICIHRRQSSSPRRRFDCNRCFVAISGCPKTHGVAFACQSKEEIEEDNHQDDRNDIVEQIIEWIFDQPPHSNKNEKVQKLLRLKDIDRLTQLMMTAQSGRARWVRAINKIDQRISGGTKNTLEVYCELETKQTTPAIGSTDAFSSYL